MEISHWTVGVLAVVVLLNTMFIAGIAVALLVLNRKLNEALDKAVPLIDKATGALGRVEEATSQLQVKVEQVLDKTTQLVDHVSERVDTTTAIAEEAITEPLIGAASLIAGINRGLQVYTSRSENRSDKGDGA